jgi:hypothetical protein
MFTRCWRLDLSITIYANILINFIIYEYIEYIEDELISLSLFLAILLVFHFDELFFEQGLF